MLRRSQRMKTDDFDDDGGTKESEGSLETEG